MRGGGQVLRLEAHPNLDQILGVFARLPHIADHELLALARAWHDDPRVARAREHALRPEGPLVLEVLAAFDALGALYDDDLTGLADYVALPAPVTETGLKAVRDAVAAAYARPVLSRGEYRRLMRPWRQVLGSGHRVLQPDLGPAAGEVTAVLSAFGRLAERCHDRDWAARWDRIETLALCDDHDERRAALDEAWAAAVAGGARRIWVLVRRSAEEAFGRPCPRCRRRPEAGDARVARLGMDAVCGLLVRASLGPRSAAVLTEPVTHLVDLRPLSRD